jgi:glutaredoxin 3
MRVGGAKADAILCKAMSRIAVYTTEPCGFCTATKALLSARGLTFAEVNLSKDEAGRAELVSRTGMLTFPQVLIDGKLIGGFRELESALQSGKLDELLAA